LRGFIIRFSLQRRDSSTDRIGDELSYFATDSQSVRLGCEPSVTLDQILAEVKTVNGVDVSARLP